MNLPKSPVQQMMSGSPKWWNNMRPPISQQVAATTHHHHHHGSNSLLPPNNLLPHFCPSSLPIWNDNQDHLPESWSQLLLGGLVGEEDKAVHLSNMQVKKLENNWDEQTFLSQPDSVNQKSIPNSYMYEHGNNVEFRQNTELTAKPTWSQMLPVSSPKSCVTTLSSNMLDFSNNNSDSKHPPPDHSSECNSGAATGGAPNKKARVQPSSTQSTFKVRKEKLGDRITALHQIVSPFGKTDTASVLLEAIGYIRFLQSQIEALSLPYLGSGSGNMRQQHQQQSVHERNSLFPEDPGQLSNDNCLKRKATSEKDYNEEPKTDLRSRGLCLVPLSCTLQVGSDNGADYWAPAFGGGFR
ncbi:transcription factor bHLH68 isoform X2 [Lycium ferocissimum]|uniref:transcription factor bHLH68 isoform X2 n=1 Tax=Lycium ferocissimum TaxID=112874 RepID=UPI0028166FAF|nr:transcription factor bHLH68 isoform X2 [Lycium ferocissimum]